MASIRFLAGIALLLAAQQLAAQAAPQLCTVAASVLQECTPLLEPVAMQAYCCSSFSAMLDLDCFCDLKTQNVSKSVLSSPVLQGIEAGCGVAALDKINDYCYTKGAVESMATGSDAGVAKIKGAEGEDTRPVLDLSLVEDSVASLFPQGEEERGVTVTYREATDGRGETLYSVDVDVPNDLDIDLDLEVDFPEAAGALADSEVIVSVAGLSQVSKNGDSLTVELSDSSSDRVYSATFPMKGAVVDEVVMDLSDVVDLVGPHVASQALQEVESARTAATTTSPDLDFEVNLTLPEGLMGQFEGKDVSIEMEYSLAEGASFNSAEITVEDGVPESSFNGKAIGDLLKEAARYMATELAIPMQPSEDQDLPELSRKETLLGGALQFLAEVGEDISVSIPDRQLHDGDFIEIERKADEVAAVGEAANQVVLTQPPVNRRSLDRLSEAIQASIYEEPRPEGTWVATCTICELVDKYLYVLWGTVVAGAAILSYYAVVAVLRRSSGAPTDPNEELKQPLIVYAADYASEGSKDALLLPIWSPPKTLQ